MTNGCAAAVHVLTVQAAERAREVFDDGLAAVADADGVRKGVFELRQKLRRSHLRGAGQQVVFEQREHFGFVGGKLVPIAAQADVD